MPALGTFPGPVLVRLRCSGAKKPDQTGLLNTTQDECRDHGVGPKECGGCRSVLSGGPHQVAANTIKWAHQCAIECGTTTMVGPTLSGPKPLNGPTRVWLNSVDTFGQAYCVAADTIKWAHQSAVECRTTITVRPTLSVPKLSNGPTKVWLNVGQYLWSGLLCCSRYHRMGPPECC